MTPQKLSSKEKFSFVLANLGNIPHDDCMNAPTHTIFPVLKFLSIENNFKEHSGAQTDSEPFFLHG